MPPTDEAVRLARLQAIFYIVTGVWPFVSMRSSVPRTALTYTLLPRRRATAAGWRDGDATIGANTCGKEAHGPR